MNIEEYLRKFQFKKLSSETKERIWQRVQKDIGDTEREKLFIIDRLWNWKYAVSVAGIILLLLSLNLHVEKYYSVEVIPIVSYKKYILDPDTEELLAFLDKNRDVSLLDYLKYIREREERRTFKDYILKIQELTG